ncbi:MAG: hypothetical protein WCC04_09155 [Terriglobales bacterium]
MPSRRIATLLFLVCIAKGYLSYGQQIMGDVVVSGIGVPSWVGHQNGFQCDLKGELFYRPDLGPENDARSVVVRVNQDGSTLLFQVPDRLDSLVRFAPANNGLVAIGRAIVAGLRPTDGPSSELRFYRFDGEGKVVAQHPISFGFSPTEMAVTSSGKTVVIGYLNRMTRQGARFAGAVLDANDKVIRLFELPEPADGGKWAGGMMEGGEGVAYALLGSLPKRSYSVATITESGRVDIADLPVPPTPPPGEWQAGRRLPIQWLLGPGGAVEEYSIYREMPSLTRFNEYDFASGKRVRTGTTPPAAAFPTSCYLGDRIVGMVRRGDGDQQSIHRVTIKLEAAQLHD